MPAAARSNSDWQIAQILTLPIPWVHTVRSPKLQGPNPTYRLSFVLLLVHAEFQSPSDTAPHFLDCMFGSRTRWDISSVYRDFPQICHDAQWYQHTSLSRWGAGAVGRKGSAGWVVRTGTLPRRNRVPRYPSYRAPAVDVSQLKAFSPTPVQTCTARGLFVEINRRIK